ncbi:MAG TPA: TRAM domain-containing protein [Mycobacteriales bacterium]|nr:TRAM domain-containing protein [Mycobacteriales bacterium]
MIVTVERVAHGGSCVGHAPDGRVVFVRHALPGERVQVVVTEERKTYLRADAVDVLEASPHRVAAPCSHAGPGKCGGCDWQHATLAHQRVMKAAVVAEQLRRLAHIDREVTVEPVADNVDGLHWRTRMRFVVDDEGRLGLRRQRSHEIEPISDCLISAPAIDVPELLGRDWPAHAEVTVDVSNTGQRAVAIGRHPDTLVERAVDRDWQVPIGGFWQVHVGAADTLADAVLSMAGPRAGERALDLYSGVGLFAGALAAAGATVTAVESDRRAVLAAQSNLADLDATVVGQRVDRYLDRSPGRVDIVVLDPPRRGAGQEVVQQVASLRPRIVVYVACDPSALARDTAALSARGYLLDDLRAFDLFPMTAHVECVAGFVPSWAQRG